MSSTNGRDASSRDIDVLFVNTFDIFGGAARAAYRTFSEIRKRSMRVHYLSLIKDSHDSDVSGRSRESALGLAVRAGARLENIPLYFYPQRQQGTFTPNFWPNPLRVRLKRFKSKLVHLHWVAAGVLGVEELARLTSPIVWTLHDGWAFTGGCHYTHECDRFKQMCGCCPQLGSQNEEDYSRKLMRRKAKVFQQLDLTVVTPSRWQAEMARKSSLFSNRRIEVIPNGLNTDVFRPIEQRAARAHLDIPSDKPVVLFGAQSVTDPRKGWDLLLHALRGLNRPYLLLVFGEGNVVVDEVPHVALRHLGRFTDEASLAMVYSAADLFVCPSREDNLPNTVAEAMACGTPCVAFAVNGLREMIEHQKNGWLARPFDPNDFAAGIQWLAERPQPGMLRQAAREKAVSEYSMAVMGNRYMALYEEVWKSVEERKTMVGRHEGR